jgi:hypothetical protein
MADSNANHSHGSRLYKGAYNATNPSAAPPGGAAAFTEIAEVISINGVPMTRASTNISHLASDNRASEAIPGRLNADTLTAQLNLTKVQYAALYAMIDDNPSSSNDQNRYKFLVWIPNGSGLYLVVKGFIQSFPFSVPDDDRVTLDVTFGLSGKPTIVSLP